MKFEAWVADEGDGLTAKYDARLEMESWRAYAAAALTGFIVASKGTDIEVPDVVDLAIRASAEMADFMLEEERKRR